MVEESVVNAEIFQAMQEAGVHPWEVALHLGRGEFAFSKMLKKELSKERREEILDLIALIAEAHKYKAERGF